MNEGNQRLKSNFSYYIVDNQSKDDDEEEYLFIQISICFYVIFLMKNEGQFSKFMEGRRSGKKMA